jgi:hypothetical protein
MSAAISGKGCPAYRCAHAGYGCAGVVASASEEALRVDRCSPDERSDIRERLPRISLRSCGLRLRRDDGDAAKKPSVLTGVARMSEATSGKDHPAYRCAHAGYGCAGVVAGAREEALRVERCSPDERSDIRERLPRMSLRSCGLRLLDRTKPLV